MNGPSVEIEVVTKGVDLSEAMRIAPKLLLENLAKAYQKIGREDIAALKKEQLSGGKGLRFMNKGAQKSFKFKASDPAKVKGFEDLFVNEYTRWPAAAIHATGGTIKGKRGAIWVLTAYGRGTGAQRRFKRADIRPSELVKSDRFDVVKFKSHRLGLLDNATGEFIAYSAKSVRMRKRLHWEELIASREAKHMETIQAAVDETLAKALGGFNEN